MYLRKQHKNSPFDHVSETLSTNRQLRRSVKFSEKSQRRRAKTRSMSILKKKSAFQSPRRMNRVKSGLLQSKYNISLTDQDCENVSNNQAIKKQYLKQIDQIPRFNCFQDKGFPVKISLLFPITRKIIQKQPQDQEDIVWKRIPEVFGSRDLVMWSVTPSGTIIKGSKHCPDYLPIGLNYLRSNKFLLRQIFERQTTNSQGIYYVKLFQNNKWQYLIIDDYIPVLQKKVGYLTTYTPVFSYITPNRLKKQPTEIWYYLLEKAYAKLYLNYQALQKGNISDFLIDITGYSCSIYNTGSTNLKWTDLFKRPEVIVVGLTFQNKAVAITKQQKSPRVYFCLPDKHGARTTLMMQQIKRYFSEIYVWGQNFYAYWGSCLIRQNNSGIISVRSFKLKNAVHCCINLIQKDIKIFPNNSKYNYSWVRFILLEKQFNGGFRWIAGEYANSKSLKIEMDLQEGEYVVLIYPEWNNKNYPLGLVLKTSLQTQLVKQSYQQGTLEEGCADLAQRFGKFNQLTKFLCSYNCFHQQMGMIIENINNQRINGSTKIRRAITGLALGNVQVYPFNKQFVNNTLEINIKSDKCYTVVLLAKGGINQKFLIQSQEESQKQC